MEELPFESGRCPRPCRPHGGDGLVHSLVALSEGNPEGLELALEVTGAEPDDRAPSTQDVEGGDSLGGQERIPVRSDQEVGVQPQPRGGGGGEGQSDQGIEGVVAAPGHPVVGREGVFGGVDGPKPSPLGRPG